jgi:hypothetical protein
MIQEVGGHQLLKIWKWMQKVCDVAGCCRPYNWLRKLYIIWETVGQILHQDLDRGKSVQGLFHTVSWMTRNL